MSLSGDFSKLDELRRRMGDVTRAGFRSELSTVLGAAAMKQVADEFREERDPYGEAWDPLRYRKGRILRKTGRMAASTNAQPDGNGFRLNIAFPAPVHQGGAFVPPHSRLAVNMRRRSTYANGIRIPQRRMVPDARGLGPIWARAFQREAAALLRRKLAAVN